MKGKKPSLMVAIGLGKPHGDEHEHEDGEHEDREELERPEEDAMAAFIDAVHKRDVKAALDAYDTLMDLCEEEEEEEGDEEEDGYGAHEEH